MNYSFSDKLREYFWRGRRYKDILARMKDVDGVNRRYVSLLNLFSFAYA